MESHNQDLVTFVNKPLCDVKLHLLSQDDQYGDQVALISDAECRHSIAHIAREVYNHEQRTVIWHKKNCGDRAGKNLVYSYLCKVHGKNEHKVHDMPTTSSALPCHFMKSPVRPCELPDLGSQYVVHLGYFESLFYVTLSKIHELHNELRIRLDHGLISPDSTIVPGRSSNGPDRQPLNVKQFLGQLHQIWNRLTRPELIATLDTAVKLRKLGHCSVVLGDGSDVLMDCRDIRASLLIQDVENIDRARFVHTPGLIDVFGTKFSPATVCLLVGDLHRSALREKEIFEARVMQTIESIRLQAERPTESEDVVDQTAAVKLPKERPESTAYTAPTLPRVSRSKTGISSFYKGDNSSRSAADLISGPVREVSTLRVNAALGHHMAPQGRRGQSRNPATLQILRAVAQAADKRRHGPKEQYPLNLYRERSTLSRKPSMAAVFDRLPSSPKATLSPRISKHLSRKVLRASRSSLRLSDTCIRTPETLLPSSSQKIVAQLLPPQCSPIDFSKQAASPQQHVTDTPLKQVTNTLSNPATIAPLQQASGGHYRTPSLTKSTQPAMPLPAVDGTWSMTKEKLYSLLPDTPLYDSPPRPMTSTPIERSTNTSFKLLRLKVGIKVHIQKV